jgi:peptidoglycan biosynthesis protein MviN/MurJ (putative lipid II flippase)
MLGFGLQAVFSRACYARQVGRVPAISAVVAMAANIPLAFVLARAIGIGGAALAGSISISIAAFILAFAMPRGTFSGLAPYTAKILLLSVPVFFVARFAHMGLAGIFTDNTLLARSVLAGAPALAGVVIYFLGAYILQIPEAVGLVKWLSQWYNRDRKGE